MCPAADRARWTYLQAGISRIMNDLEQGIDMQMYMGVYTYVFPGAFPLPAPSLMLI